MTIDEAKAMLAESFLSFPSVAEWLNEKSPNAAKTISLWAEVLSGIERDEAAKVLHAWRHGKIQPPAAYERDCFALIWKQTALHLRSEANRDRALNEQKAILAEGAKKPFSLATDDLYNNEWLPMKAMVDAGQLTKEEALGRWKQRLNEVFK